MSLITAYNPLPISFTHGKGVWLYDKDNNAYLDSACGIAVTGLGHAHPDVVRAITEQAKKLLHTSNMVEIPEQIALAKKLTDICNMEQAFFNNSGAEANETAIKISRLFGHKKGIETPSVIVMEGAFHGRTIATLSASGNRKVRAGFDPLLPGFIRAPYNDIEALKTIASNREDIVAVMLETVQGESGVNLADENYLHEVANLCHMHDWLLIFDEVQTGNGRLGSMYDCLNLKITPDVLTTAKGLGNGVPIGACLMGGKALDIITPGSHGSTFGGNPLATHVGLTVLEVIERDKLCEKVKKQAPVFMNSLKDALKEFDNIKEIRGKGFMIGIELTENASELRKIALQHGLMINVAAEKVIRLLLPLIITDEELEILLERLVKSLRQFKDK